MAINNDAFNDFEDFEQEDNASFAVGSNDINGYWFSQANTDTGDTISGLFVQTGRDAFDDAVEAFMAKNPKYVQRVTVVHDASNENGSRSNGSNEKEYWCFNLINLFVLSKGMKEPLAEQGIVYVWTVDEKRTVKVGKGGKPQPNLSHLRFRAIIADLLPYDFSTPLQISVRSSKAAYFLDYLKTQKRVIQSYREQSGKIDAAIPFWAFSLPLVKMPKVVSVGSEKKKNMVMPMAHVPEALTPGYFKEHYVPTTLRETIKVLLSETVEWAQETRSALLKGEEAQSTTQSTNAVSEPSSDDSEGYPDAPVDDEEQQPSGKLATDQQRKALSNLGKRLKNNDYIAASANAALTFEAAAAMITKANKHVDDLVNTP